MPTRDVQQHLDDAFQASLTDNRRSLPADAPIITRFSSTNSNLDKPLKLIIEKAGLIPWPKLFQNMRASCETQWLKDGERADLVANWMGHSVKVQNLNYVQHTDDDIEAFNQKPAFKSRNHGGNKQPRTGANWCELVRTGANWCECAKSGNTGGNIETAENQRFSW